MRKIFLLIGLQAIWTAGFAQSLPFPQNWARFSYQATNFDIAWNVPEHSWPEFVWVYGTKRSSFTPESVSNLLKIGSFNKADIRDYGSYGIGANNSGRVLSIRPATGSIYYFAPQSYGLNHLTTNVPDTNQIVALTTNLLPKIGIRLSELLQTKSGQPKISYATDDVGMIYFTADNTPVTNLNHRIVAFRRVLDGMKYEGIGGSGWIDYGENGKVIGINIEWHGVKRLKQYKTATKQEILQWLRDGHCYFPHWFYPPYQDKIDIDWTKVKHLTIKRVEVCYYGSDFPHDELPLRSLVSPYSDLLATVDTGTTNLNIEIDCPIIDETKPLKIKP